MSKLLTRDELMGLISQVAYYDVPDDWQRVEDAVSDLYARLDVLRLEVDRLRARLKAIDDATGSVA
jgi:hypothetical protein